MNPHKSPIKKKNRDSTYIIGEAFKNARASATRCFSPPLNCKEKPPNICKFRN